MLAVALFSIDIFIYIWQLRAFLLQLSHREVCTIGSLPQLFRDPREKGKTTANTEVHTRGSLVKIETGITLTD